MVKTLKHGSKLWDSIIHLKLLTYQLINVKKTFLSTTFSAFLVKYINHYLPKFHDQSVICFKLTPGMPLQWRTLDKYWFIFSFLLFFVWFKPPSTPETPQLLPPPPTSDKIFLPVRQGEVWFRSQFHLGSISDALWCVMLPSTARGTGVPTVGRNSLLRLHPPTPTPGMARLCAIPCSTGERERELSRLPQSTIHHLNKRNRLTLNVRRDGAGVPTRVGGQVGRI